MPLAGTIATLAGTGVLNVRAGSLGVCGTTMYSIAGAGFHKG